MIIECHICEAMVDAKLIAEHKSCDADDPAEFYSHLLECPQCHTTLLGGRYEFEDPGDPLTRMWPQPIRHLSISIPLATRNSLEEARLCFKARAYSACTVMSGRALEGICRHFGTQKVNLGPGIKQLREKGIIDARLGTWAEELQKARNLSAHASEEKVTKEDAQDLLDFVEAICEYVFVLTAKFDSYMARRKKPNGHSPPTSDLDEGS
jgi:Domain of unknown function (DUF4145)